MRFFFLMAGLLILAGCQSYFDEQQAMVDRQNAERDRAWCQSVGIGETDERYPVCRAYALELRMQGQVANDARALALMGLGTGAVTSANRTTNTTCQQFGNGINCQSW